MTDEAAECGASGKDPAAGGLTMAGKPESNASLVFRKIAIPFSVLWLLRNAYLVLSDFDADNPALMVLALAVPLLLFVAAAAKGNPYKKQKP